MTNTRVETAEELSGRRANMLHGVCDLVDELRHFDVALGESSAVVSRQGDLDLQGDRGTIVVVSGQASRLC